MNDICVRCSTPLGKKYFAAGDGFICCACDEAETSEKLGDVAGNEDSVIEPLVIGYTVIIRKWRYQTASYDTPWVFDVDADSPKSAKDHALSEFASRHTVDFFQNSRDGIRICVFPADAETIFNMRLNCETVSEAFTQ